jgi:nucleoside-diphosphate-sugar epimerase
MKYFVTGATGFIGGCLARQLVAAGHHVVALVRSPAKAEALKQLGCQLHPGDITDKESMRPGMAGCDGVFHAAAWYQIGVRKDDCDFVNVDGTQNVLQLMRELAIPRGVYTSTVAVFSDTHGQVVDESYRHRGALHGWLSDYERTKWLAHYEVAIPAIEKGLPLIIVQPGLTYGPGDSSAVRTLLHDYLNRKLPALPSGTAYCWAHVEDTAHGHLLAMEKGRPGQSYIIAGPRHTMVEALEIAEGITGIPAPRRRLSPALLRAGALIAGVLERRFTLPSKYSSEMLRGLAGVTYLASSAKAEQELGFQARPLEVGLRETLEHERSHA